ncbi:hypothetical protein [Anaerocolumna sedimenticola]|nr:hypothetical protein [Anaerocolumna sedimenticola]
MRDMNSFGRRVYTCQLALVDLNYYAKDCLDSFNESLEDDNKYKE